MVLSVMSFDERYRAVESRDRRFDGQFILAVRTTGIYCRPSCPARTPKPSNVVFYPTSAAAHEAGFRACKRCLPEAAPGSPQWNLRNDVARRAMTLIAEGVVEREGVGALAARLGYSSRQLNRILLSELGAGPLALARSQRAHTARLMLTNTELSISQVGFAAGFGSLRQFNDTMREVFDLTPSEVRARRRDVSRPTSGALELLLPVRSPFDLAGVLAWLGERAIAGVELADAEGYARTVRMAGGPAWFRVYASGSTESAVRVAVRVSDVRDVGPLIARVRSLFDLDADPVAIDAALARHAQLAPLVRAVPGIRVPGAADPAERLLRTMVSQQVSTSAARTAITRVVEALGVRVEAPEGEPNTLFPTPQAIAREGHEVLRGPAARVNAVLSVARALAEGALSISAADDPAEQRAALLAQPGIGPWTADYVRMRVVGDPDVLLSGDLAVRNGAARVGVPAQPRELERWAARVAPWRSYLCAHLWRAAVAGEPGPATSMVSEGGVSRDNSF